MTMGLLPPKKKDWVPGSPQVGVFLRTAQGTVIETVHDRATNDEQAFVAALIRGVHLLPDKLVMAVRAELAKATIPGMQKPGPGTISTQPVMPTNKQAPKAYRAPKKKRRSSK